MAKVKKEQLQEVVVDPYEKIGFLLQALYETEGCFNSPASKPSSATRYVASINFLHGRGIFMMASDSSINLFPHITIYLVMPYCHLS